jgi:hypothetical protein
LLRGACPRDEFAEVDAILANKRPMSPVSPSTASASAIQSRGAHVHDLRASDLLSASLLARRREKTQRRQLRPPLFIPKAIAWLVTRNNGNTYRGR